MPFSYDIVVCWRKARGLCSSSTSPRNTFAVRATAVSRRLSSETPLRRVGWCQYVRFRQRDGRHFVATLCSSSLTHERTSLTHERTIPTMAQPARRAARCTHRCRSWCHRRTACYGLRAGMMMTTLPSARSRDFTCAWDSFTPSLLRPSPRCSPRAREPASLLLASLWHPCEPCGSGATCARQSRSGTRPGPPRATIQTSTAAHVSSGIGR